MTSYTTLATDTVRCDYAPVLLAQSEPTLMDAGLAYPATGTWWGTSEIGSLMACQLRARRVDQAGLVEYGVWTSRNHVGVEHGDTGVQSVHGRFLFTPPSTGMWVVELWGQAGRHEAELRHNAMSATAVNLTVYSGRFGGVEWVYDGPNLQVSAAGPKAAWCLQRTLELPEITWPAGRNARLWTGTQVTCYSTGAHNPFVGRVTTYVNQVDAAGNVIRSWVHDTTEEITGTERHWKHHHSLTLDPVWTGTAPVFRVSVRLLWVAADGEPDRHGGLVNGAGSGAAYTAAHAYPLL